MDGGVAALVPKSLCASGINMRVMFNHAKPIRERGFSGLWGILLDSIVHSEYTEYFIDGEINIMKILVVIFCSLWEK